MLCLCVYPNALEDYLCWLGLLICRSVWVMLEWFGLFLVTWYISYAGGSWNLTGECSFDLFSACKQAYLVVLTVNVIVVYFWFYDVVFCFFLSCLCSVGFKQHKPLAGRASYKVGANTYWQCSFFIKCLLSVMNVFISGPALTSEENMLSVWDWGGGRTPFLFFVLFFILRISSWESKMRHKT